MQIHSSLFLGRIRFKDEQIKQLQAADEHGNLTCSSETSYIYTPAVQIHVMSAVGMYQLQLENKMSVIM